MSPKVLLILTTASLIGLASCDNNNEDTPTKSNWRFPPAFNATPDKRMGRQMPPHHEPDAVVITVDENGKRITPEGGYPRLPGGGPGVFGIPGDPRVFGFPGPGVNLRPDAFGPPARPGVFGIPGFPNIFGIPGFHTVRDSGVYGASGGVGGVFVPPQGPTGPNLFGVRMHQNGPGFTTVRTGVFGAPLPPEEQSMFGQPGVFAVAGSGNYPYPGAPGFFFPGRGPPFPGGADGFPRTRGRSPETFVPGSRGILPDGYYPEGPTVPNQPRDSDGSFPRREFYGGPGNRETYDDPAADVFPLINASPSVFEVHS